MIKLVPYKYRIQSSPRREACLIIKKVGKKAMAQREFSLYFQIGQVSQHLYILRENAWDDAYYQPWIDNPQMLSPVKKVEADMVE